MVARFTELTLNSFVVINHIDVDVEDIRAQAEQAPLCRPVKLKLSTLNYPRHRGDMIEQVVEVSKKVCITAASLGPHRVHKPSSISICSAISAQLTASQSVFGPARARPFY